MDNEIWLPIAGFPKYQISNIGRVKNVSTNKVRKHSFDKDGYPRLNLMIEGNIQKNVHVHKLVCKSFIGEKPDNHIVNHKNGIKDDNTADNLEWVSYRENSCHFMKGKFLRYVSQHGKKYRAQLRLNSKILNLGVYNTELEAHNRAVEYLAENNIRNKYI